MERVEKFLDKLPPYLLSYVASALTIAQIALAVFLPPRASTALQWAGWICLWMSAPFGVLPILTFKRRGGVAKGDSYIHTTQLVNSGIYALVRHPQGGTAWLLINLGLMLISGHWLSAALGVVSMCLAYLDTFKLDQSCIKKFGGSYEEYMEKVPRVNFIKGLFRLVLKRPQ